MELPIKQIRIEAPQGDAHPFNLAVVKGLAQDVPLSPLTFFSGPNGCGKTTLLEAMAVAVGIDRYGGSINMVQKSDPPVLAKYLVLGRGRRVKDAFFFRAETFFGIQERVRDVSPGLIHQYTGSEKTFRELSHGEGFRAFFENRIRPGGLYFLDEPESALTFERQIELLFILNEFMRVDCQFIVATHSPVLLCHPRATIFALDKGMVRVLFESTLAFRQITDFLSAYPRLQKELL